MNVKTLKKLLATIPNNRDVLVQLPDNDPPVPFTLDLIGSTLVILPSPPKDTYWDHETNVITYSRSNG